MGDINVVEEKLNGLKLHRERMRSNLREDNRLLFEQELTSLEMRIENKEADLAELRIINEERKMFSKQKDEWEAKKFKVQAKQTLLAEKLEKCNREISKLEAKLQ